MVLCSTVLRAYSCTNLLCPLESSSSSVCDDTLDTASNNDLRKQQNSNIVRRCWRRIGVRFMSKWFDALSCRVTSHTHNSPAGCAQNDVSTRSGHPVVQRYIRRPSTFALSTLSPTLCTAIVSPSNICCRFDVYVFVVQRNATLLKNDIGMFNHDHIYHSNPPAVVCWGLLYT